LRNGEGKAVARNFLNSIRLLEDRLDSELERSASPLGRIIGRIALVISGAVLGLVLIVVGISRSDQATIAFEAGTVTAASFAPPDESEIPEGPLGDAIIRGKAIFDNPGVNAAAYVGNAMACKNCHLDSGRRAGSSPMWSAWGKYPQYRNKNKSINTMEDRIMGCFRYSMNAPASASGAPPPAGSDIYRDLQTYFHWLATGAPTGKDMVGAGYPELELTSTGYDPQRGAPLYDQYCSGCHGPEGQGAIQPDGTVVYPPLWGNESYNWGAGMARVDLAARFIKANMPFDRPGTLTSQEAWDIAAFMDSQERPRDPRQTGSIDDNAKRSFAGQESFYGKIVDGHQLGSGGGAR
jgi:thiosulfate dehydrogenase